MLLGRDFSVSSHRSSHKQNRQHVLLGNYNLVIYNVYIIYIYDLYDYMCQYFKYYLYSILKYLKICICVLPGIHWPRRYKRPKEQFSASTPSTSSWRISTWDRRSSTVVVGDEIYWNIFGEWGDVNTFQSSILNKCFCLSYPENRRGSVRRWQWKCHCNPSKQSEGRRKIMEKSTVLTEQLLTWDQVQLYPFLPRVALFNLSVCAFGLFRSKNCAAIPYSPSSK